MTFACRDMNKGWNEDVQDVHKYHQGNTPALKSGRVGSQVNSFDPVPALLYTTQFIEDKQVGETEKSSPKAQILLFQFRSNPAWNQIRFVRKQVQKYAIKAIKLCHNHWTAFISELILSSNFTFKVIITCFNICKVVCFNILHLTYYRYRVRLKGLCFVAR